MFDIQAIPDNMNLKYQYLNPFGTSWPQELPVDHTEWLQTTQNCSKTNKNKWEK